MRIIRNDDRGRSNYGWLDSRHTFSFADYYDPDNKGISVLRVINDDTVAPGNGFETHSHWNMEIISYILEGTIEHKDSLGNINQLKAGEFQVMTTGTGVTHSEYNPSLTERLRFLQIWILPDTKGLTPSYADKVFPTDKKRQFIASPDERGGSLRINQDATLERLYLADGDIEVLCADTGRTGMLHIVSGETETPAASLSAGDAVVLDGSNELKMTARADTELLWFDLP